MHLPHPGICYDLYQVRNRNSSLASNSSCLGMATRPFEAVDRGVPLAPSTSAPVDAHSSSSTRWSRYIAAASPLYTHQIERNIIIASIWNRREYHQRIHHIEGNTIILKGISSYHPSYRREYHPSYRREHHHTIHQIEENIIIPSIRYRS